MTHHLTTPTEIWKKVTGFETYEVSNFGRVRSLNRQVGCKGGHTLIKKGKILKPFIVGGYYCVGLWSKSKTKTSRVSRIEAEAFIPNPENKSQVNHNDGNKLNNHLPNLEWATPRENTQHAIRTGLANPRKFTIGDMMKGIAVCGKQVVAKNIHTDKETTFRSLRECSRKLGKSRFVITTSIKTKRIENNKYILSFYAPTK